MAAPTEKTDYLASEASYEGIGKRPNDINGFHLLQQYSTPTISAFMNGTSILIAIRGTADARDARADLAIPFGRLAKSDRYLADKSTVQALIAAYPPAQFSYYMTGHSLGSAIGLQLQRDFPIKAGTFFNGALSPADVWKGNQTDKEIYTDSDPLYKIMGRFWRGPKTVIPAANLSGLSNVVSRGIDAIKAHGLAQFRALYGSGEAGDGVGALAGLNGWIAAPLSDADIRHLLGQSISILSYPQLRSIKHIEDGFDVWGRLITLFLTTSATSGHWQTVHVSGPNEIEFFDSYGQAPDQCFEWETPQQLREFHETRKEIVRLLHDAERRGIKVVINRHRFQSMRPDVATCGRWCCLRLLFGFQNLHEFARMVITSGLAPDVFVAVVTHGLINK